MWLIRFLAFLFNFTVMKIKMRQVGLWMASDDGRLFEILPGQQSLQVYFMSNKCRIGHRWRGSRSRVFSRNMRQLRRGSLFAGSNSGP